MNNVGMPWSSRDDAALKSMVKEGCTKGHIANSLGRTYGSISSRMEKHNLHDHDSLRQAGWSQEQIQSMSAPVAQAPVFNPTQKETTMNMVTTQVMVGLRKASDLSMDEILNIIEHEETFIKRLEALRNQTPAVVKLTTKHINNVKKLNIILTKG